MTAIAQRNPELSPVNGNPATFIPKTPVTSVAGRKTVVTIASTCRLRLVCSLPLKAVGEHQARQGLGLRFGDIVGRLDL